MDREGVVVCLALTPRQDETDVMDRVHKERKSRGVVIYATNELYDKLSA